LTPIAVEEVSIASTAIAVKTNVTVMDVEQASCFNCFNSNSGKNLPIPQVLQVKSLFQLLQQQ